MGLGKRPVWPSFVFCPVLSLRTLPLCPCHILYLRQHPHHLPFCLTWILVIPPLSMKDGGSSRVWAEGQGLPSTTVHSNGKPQHTRCLHKPVLDRDWIPKLLQTNEGQIPGQVSSPPLSATAKSQLLLQSEFQNSVSFPHALLPQTQKQTSCGQAHIGATYGGSLPGREGKRPRFSKVARRRFQALMPQNTPVKQKQLFSSSG